MQKVIQLVVLIVMLVVFDYTVLMIYGRTIRLLFSPLIDLIVVNLFSSPPQPWMLMPALLVVGVLALILMLLRQSLKPRASISVTLPPPPAEPEQAHG